MGNILRLIQIRLIVRMQVRPYKVYETLVVRFCAAQWRLTVHVCVKQGDSGIVRFEFTKGSQLFLSLHNETLSLAAWAAFY